jgi:hypothetical protein
MSLPTFVGRTVFAHGTAGISVDFTSLSGGAGTPFVAGDWLVIAAESANQAIAAPTGFTEDASSPVGIGTAATAGAVRVAAFYRVADGTETTVSIADSGDHTTAIGFVFRPAASEAIAIEATAPGTPVATGVTATMTAPAVTTSVANCLILNFFGMDRDLISANAVGAPTNASLANLTRRGGETTTDAAGGGCGLVTGELATAGSSGTTTASQGSSVASATLTIALKGVATGVTASGSIGTVAATAPTGTASGDGSASGSIGTATATAPSGNAYVDVTASGSIGTATATAPTGSATGDAVAAGLIGSVQATPPLGYAVGDTPASGVDTCYPLHRRRLSR